MRKLARLTQFGSALSVLTAVAIYLYYNVWYAAYYYPGRYEYALMPMFVALILAAGGVMGGLGATIVLWRWPARASSRTPRIP